MKMRFERLTLSAVALLAESALRNSVTAQKSCLTPGSGFSLELGGACNYTTVLNAFQAQVFSDPINVGTNCLNTAAQDLAFLLGAANPQVAIASLCKEATDKGPTTAFHRAAAKGTDLAFEQLYYNGGSEWNEQVQTTEDGIEKHILKRDAKLVLSFYEINAKETQVAWPGSLTNFNLSSCSANAAMCCWVTDRQANDNNGNCNSPYDVNCVNKDPADNTDLCYMSHPDGNLSSKFDSANGFSGFPGDDNDNSKDAEGPIHCHGFAWSTDASEVTARYKGNNLFYVSMYDHMYQRGYVRNVPGAPMCACVEQMPVVSRSDCTQTDVTESYSMLYDGVKFYVSLDSIEVAYNACRGIDNRNNDLWAHVGRLYQEGRVSAKEWALLGQTIVEKDNCEVAMNFHLASSYNYIVGYNHDKSKWTRAVAKGVLQPLDEGQYGREGFKASWNVSGKNIMMRKCQDCALSHQTVFYKRKTPVPVDNPAIVPADLVQYALSDLLKILSNYRDGGNRSLPGHVYGTDFEIYSTLDDALAGTNEWKCTNYKYTSAFPGNCSPNGGTLIGQDAVMEYLWMGKQNAAWYFPSDITQPKLEASSNVGTNNPAGQTLEKSGKYYMTAIGGDIWGVQDNFHFFSTPKSGDVTISVKVTNLEAASSSTKAGLMIRSSLAPNASHFNVVLTGVDDVWQQRRMTDGATTSSNMCTGCSYYSKRKTAFLMITKRMRTFIAYESKDGANWTQVGSVYNFDNMNQYHVGLVLASNSGDRYSESLFENYVVDSYFYPSAAPSKVPALVSVMPSLVVGLGTCTNCSGSTSVQGSKITMKSRSRDVWGTSDQFQFYKPNVPFTQGIALTTNFDITVRLINWSGAQIWSKAGLMVRDSTHAAAADFFMLVPEAHNPLIQYRLTNGASTIRISPDEWNTYPSDMWLKISKRGSVLSGFYRRPNLEVWNKMGEVTIAFANASGLGLQVGLAVASNSQGVESVAVFQDYKYNVV